MTKITSALLILRQGKSPSWTTARDSAMNTWISTYVKWLLTDKIGTEELASGNNHGTFVSQSFPIIQLKVSYIFFRHVSLRGP